MRRTAAKIAVGVLLIGLWLGHVEREHRAIEPNGATLPTVVAKLPSVESACVFGGPGGTEYLAVFGPTLPLLCFPSGGPVYIFNQTGSLVDWTSDSGDDDRFRNRWPGAFGGRAISRDEVMGRAEVK